jgi:hydrogenase maturation protease
VSGSAAACLGNRDRGDDAAGPLVADRLRAAGAELLDCNDDPTRLIDTWAGLDLVVVVDAVRSGSAPGTVHRFETRDGPLPRELGLASTHLISIADTLELGRTLGRAPARVVVLGVEGASFELGAPITPEVEAAVPAVADAVLAELAKEA